MSINKLHFSPSRVTLDDLSPYSNTPTSLSLWWANPLQPECMVRNPSIRHSTWDICSFPLASTRPCTRRPSPLPVIIKLNAIKDTHGSMLYTRRCAMCVHACDSCVASEWKIDKRKHYSQWNICFFPRSTASTSPVENGWGNRPKLTQNAKLKIINNDLMHAIAATVCIKSAIETLSISSSTPEHSL